jgi:hypothetical protein
MVDFLFKAFEKKRFASRSFGPRNFVSFNLCSFILLLRGALSSWDEIGSSFLFKSFLYLKTEGSEYFGTFCF